MGSAWVPLVVLIDHAARLGRARRSDDERWTATGEVLRERPATARQDHARTQHASERRPHDVQLAGIAPAPLELAHDADSDRDDPAEQQRKRNDDPAAMTEHAVHPKRMTRMQRTL